MRGTREGPISVQYHVYIMYMCSPLAYTHLESQVPVVADNSTVDGSSLCSMYLGSLHLDNTAF